MDVEMFHYMKLRGLVESIEAALQVALQSYIAIRLWNPFGNLPPVVFDGLNPRTLAVSLFFSVYNLYDQLSFLRRFAKLQCNGRVGTFLLKMSQLGKGLAPSSIYEALRKSRVVDVHFNLSNASLPELFRIAQVARRSITLQKLCFLDCRFLDAMHAEGGDEEINSWMVELLLAEHLQTISLQRVAEERHVCLVQNVQNNILAAPAFEELFINGERCQVERQCKAERTEDVEILPILLTGNWKNAREQLLKRKISLSEDWVLQLCKHSSCHKTLSLLLAAGADVAEGALNEAACNDATSIIQVLLRHRADVNSVFEDSSPLEIAAQSSCHKAVRLLLAARTDVSMHGPAAARAAAFTDDVEMLRLFISQKADINAQCPLSGNDRALHLAADRGASECLKELLRCRADASLVDGNGATALSRAARNRKCVEMLLPLSDVHARDNDGITALQRAAGDNDVAMLELLQNAGAEIEALDDAGDAALAFAAIEGAQDAIQYCIRQRCDVNRQNKHGRSPLMHAAAGNHVQALCLLLGSGAAVETVDEDGNTALHLVGQRAQEEEEEECEDSEDEEGEGEEAEGEEDGGIEGDKAEGEEEEEGLEQEEGEGGREDEGEGGDAEREEGAGNAEGDGQLRELEAEAELDAQLQELEEEAEALLRQEQGGEEGEGEKNAEGEQGEQGEEDENAGGEEEVEEGKADEEYAEGEEGEEEVQVQEQAEAQVEEARQKVSAKIEGRSSMCIKVLLDHRAHVNHANHSGETALMLTKSAKCVKLLLHSRADPHDIVEKPNPGDAESADALIQDLLKEE